MTAKEKPQTRLEALELKGRLGEFSGALNYTEVKEYKLGKMLGQGAYAMVREAYHIDTGFVVAVKIYDKAKLNQNAQTKKSV